MRLSCFNHYVPDYPEPGSTLIHNTLSGGYMVVDDDTLAALRKADGGAPLSQAEVDRNLSMPKRLGSGGDYPH